jgi:hypothetical protein
MKFAVLDHLHVNVSDRSSKTRSSVAFSAFLPRSATQKYSEKPDDQVLHLRLLRFTSLCRRVNILKALSIHFYFTTRLVRRSLSLSLSLSLTCSFVVRISSTFNIINFRPISVRAFVFSLSLSLSLFTNLVLVHFLSEFLCKCGYSDFGELVVSPLPCVCACVS